MTRYQLAAFTFVVTFAFLVAGLSASPAQLPSLPDGAATRWVVSQPEEIVRFLLFDPATVERQRPSSLRFITVKELAIGGVPWAVDYLAATPSRGAWGVSFLEILRAGTFTIDAHAPSWPEHGAAAVWLARVAPADAKADLGTGQPFLMLGFWMPDRQYVAEMNRLGHYAEFGDVRLQQDSGGKWVGSLNVDGLSVVAECTPTGPISGGPQSRGTQALFPPATSSVTDVVRIAFAGHRVRACTDDSAWTLRGTHPLARGVFVGAADFQFGYELVGGAYRR
jgi:hypothetical protein